MPRHRQSIRGSLRGDDREAHMKCERADAELVNKLIHWTATCDDAHEEDEEEEERRRRV